MKIGILVPLPQELSSLTKLKLQPGNCVGLTEHIRVCLSGVGRRSTRLGFEKLLSDPVDLVISWGSAAGLNEAVEAGDLLIPEAINVGNQMIRTNHDFNRQLISHLPQTLRIHKDPLAECKGVLATVEDKRNLYEATGCMAADMESGALAQLAEQHQVPFAVIRSVVDEAEMPLPSALLKGFGKGGFDLPAFLGNALIKPSDWPLITKLAMNFKKVKKTLNIASDIIKTNSNTWR